MSGLRAPPSRSLSLPLSLLSHTHAEVPERNRELTGEFLGIVGIGRRGGKPPLGCWRDSSLHLPASPSPSPRLQPVLAGGAAVTVPPRPRDPKCEEGPLPSPSPGRRVGSRMPARPARTAGCVVSPDELSWPRAAGVCSPLPRLPLGGGHSSLRTSVGFFPPSPLSLRFPNF